MSHQKEEKGQFTYSDKYMDETYEYRHVVVNYKEVIEQLPKHVMSESEWRKLGVQQSRGWEHYAIHRPEPHILLFRRHLGTNPQTGEITQASHEEAARRVRMELDRK